MGLSITKNGGYNHRIEWDFTADGSGVALSPAFPGNGQLVTIEYPGGAGALTPSLVQQASTVNLISDVTAFASGGGVKNAGDHGAPGLSGDLKIGVSGATASASGTLYLVCRGPSDMPAQELTLS